VSRNRALRGVALLASVALVFGALSLPVTAAPSRRITINSVQISEGNTGEKLLTFTVQVKGPNASGVSVDWETADDTATAGQDYETASGTISFAGSKQRQVHVSIVGDETIEPDERFEVILSNAANANISQPRGVGTILNDDVAPPALPTLSVVDDTVGEGNTGTTTASFEVNLSASATSEVTVDFDTADGSATAPSDYETTAGTVTFVPGDTTEFISVPVNGDTTDEGASQDFTVSLSNPSGATIASGEGTATGTIIDDESSPAISVEDTTPVSEGNSGTANATFTVTLSHASSEDVSVDYATAEGTALDPEDFEAVGDTFVIPSGETSHDVTINVVGDNLDESDEFFTLGITKPPNALAADMEAKGFITDDDTSRASVSNTAAREGSGPAAFVISLNKPSSQIVSVAYATSNGSAKVTTDYRSEAATVSFASGETSKTVNVAIVDDRVHETRETFSLNLNQTLNAELGNGSGTGTIRDNDRAPSATTLKARKRSGTIRARGLLSPAHKGRRMTVTLKKRTNGRWVKVRTKRPLLSGSLDLNGDGIRDSRYRTRFFNPKNTKRCRVIARFPGDLHHRPSKALRSFSC
jgi:hypothetical protein